MSTQPIFEFVSPVGGFRANCAHHQAHRAAPEAPRLCNAPSGSFRVGPTYRLAGVRTASRPASRPRGAHIGTSRRASGAGWRRFGARNRRGLSLTSAVASGCSGRRVGGASVVSVPFASFGVVGGIADGLSARATQLVSSRVILGVALGSPPFACVVHDPRGGAERVRDLVGGRWGRATFLCYTPASEVGDSDCACARGRRVRGRRV